MIKIISDKIASLLSEYLNYSKKESAYLSYGLQLILGLLWEILLILLTAYYLDIFWPVLVSSLSFFILRKSAGGVHLPTYLLCLLFSLITFIFIGKLVQLSQLNTLTLILWLGLTTFTAIKMINKYAPKDTEIIPIKDPEIRQLLKSRSRKIVFSWLIISIIITIWFNHYNQLVFAGSLGIWAELMALHPLIYRLVDRYLPRHN